VHHATSVSTTATLASPRARLALAAFAASALAAAAVGLVAAPAKAQDLPPAGAIAITGFSYTGLGCTPGSVAQNLSPDGQALTLIFSQYQVEGGLTGPTHQQVVQRGCELTLAVRVPAGWQFSISSVVFRGFAWLDQGTRGVHNATFRYAASPLDNFLALGQATFTGPYDDAYESVNNIRYDALGWSPCTATDGQVLKIRSTIQVNGRHGLIGVDSQDVAVAERYGLSYRRCTDPGRGIPVKNLGTVGTVRRNSSLCLDYRSGRMSFTAPAGAGAAQDLTHTMNRITNEATSVKRQTGPLDSFVLPGDWNSVAYTDPVVVLRPAVAGAVPRFTVDQRPPSTTCVNVLDAPGALQINWRLPYAGT
jgi:hypothetical protein